MRIPEKPAGGALLASAGADRRDPLASGQLPTLLPLRFARSLGDFTSFLAPPPTSSTPSANRLPAPSESRALSSPQNQSPSRRTTDSDAAPSSDSSSDEASDEWSADDTQPSNALVPLAVQAEPAPVPAEEIADEGAVVLSDAAPDSEDSQRPTQDALLASAAKARSRAADGNLSSATAVAADRTAQDTAAPETVGVQPNTAGQSAATANATSAPLGQGMGSVQTAAEPETALNPQPALSQPPALSQQPAFSQQPALSQQPAAGDGQRDTQQTPEATSDVTAENAADIPASPTAPNETARRGGRRTAAEAARSRESTSNRRAAEPANAPDHSNPVTVANAPQNVPIANDAAAAGLAENPIAAPLDALPAGMQAAVTAATSIRPGTSEAAAIAPNHHDAVSPTAVSAADPADRFSDRAAGQRTDEQTRTDIADRARLVHRIAKALTKMGTDGGQVRMRMHPETLGSVLLEMRVRGRSVEARVTAANETSLDLLRQQLPDLRQRLESQGMTVQRLDVELHDENGASNSYPFGDDSAGNHRWSDDRTATRDNRSGTANRLGQDAATTADARGRLVSGISPRTQPAAPGTLDLSL